MSGWPIEFRAAIAACRTAGSPSPSRPSSGSNAAASPMRASAPAAGTASSRSSSASTSAGVARRSPIRPERHRRGLPRVEVLGAATARSSSVDDAGAVPHQRLDDLRSHGLLTEQSRQGALRPPGRSSHPSTRAIPAQSIRSRHDATASRRFCVPAAVMVRRTTGRQCARRRRSDLVAVVQAASASATTSVGASGRIRAAAPAARHVFVAQLAERLGHRRAQQLVGEQRHQPRRNVGFPSRLSAWTAGNARKKSPLLGDRRVNRSAASTACSRSASMA